MADDSTLDDFFAKKDKNKKSKKKFTTTEQIARKLEESGRKSVSEMATKKEKEKPSSATAPAVSQVTEQNSNRKQASSLIIKDDEEWKDFEEEKEKDYTGLKIANYQNEPKDEDNQDRNQDDEDGEIARSKGAQGPWSGSSRHHSAAAAAAAAAAIIDEQPERPPTPPSPVVEVEKKEEVVKGVYRPPHARGSSGSTPGERTSKPRHGGKNTAPELGSEFHFPSLSSAEATPKAKKGDWESDRGFESVKRGSRNTEEVVNRGPKLDLGNKFNALSQDLS